MDEETGEIKLRVRPDEEKLMLLRVQLYSAAQSLKDESVKEFKALLKEVLDVVEVTRSR